MASEESQNVPQDENQEGTEPKVCLAHFVFYFTCEMKLLVYAHVVTAV